MTSGKYRIAAGIVFWLLAVLFVIFVFVPSVKKINTDFPNYYVSSNMLLDGKNLKDVYDNVEFNRQLLIYGIEGQIVSFVPYPPVNALLMLPIAKLPPLDAKLVWNFFNALLLIACIYTLTRIVPLDFYSIGIIFFLSAYALANNFLFGQAYLLILFLLLLSVHFMIQGKDILSALFLSISIVLKFYTVFFIFLFIFKGRFRLALWSVIFCLILYVPIILITGFDLNYFYFTEFMPRLGDGWVGTVYAAEYQSFVSLLHRLFHYEPALNPYPLVQSELLFYLFKYLWISGILFVSLAFVNKSNENLKLELSLFCITALLLLPLNASYQFVILVPAVVFMSEHFLGQKKYSQPAVIVLVMALMNSPVQVWMVNQLSSGPLFILAYVKLMGLLCLWFMNLRLLKGETPSFRVLKITLGGLSFAALLTVISFVSVKDTNDNAVPLVNSRNFLITMPSALNTIPEKFVYTECVNEKFVLRSNFGPSIDTESIFYPRMVNEYMLEYETVEDRVAVKKILDFTTSERVLTKPSKRVTPEISKSGKWQCYVENGQVIIEELRTGIRTQLTRGRQFCSFPRFAENDTKIIFASDRYRGVGFTALYEIEIPEK